MEARCDETSTDVPAGAAVKEEIVESAKQNEQIQVQPGYNNNNDEEDADVVVCTESQEAEIRDALSKCVFCEKTFATSDEPKLLECLHASCTSCVKNKLAENTAVDADIQRKSDHLFMTFSFLFFYSNHFWGYVRPCLCNMWFHILI